MLVRFSDGLGWLDRLVAGVFVAHFFNHSQVGQILEVSAGFTVAEVLIEGVGNEAATVSLVARDASEDKVDFQLFFSRHF